MTEKDKNLGAAINAICKRLGPLLSDEENDLAAAIALAMLSANHAIHSVRGQPTTLDLAHAQYVNVCKAAWIAAADAHLKSGALREDAGDPS